MTRTLSRHAALLLLLAACTTSSEAPDIILTGGKVFTADSARPWAQAIAVRGERIVAVGTTEEIARLAGTGTRRIDLAGRTVVPGFDDAHDHVGESGPDATFFATDASGTPDPALDVVLDSVRALAARLPAGTWIRTSVGGRIFDDARATRAVLDAVAPAHPVWIGGWSGHGGIMNTTALRAAGLLDAPDPAGGWMGRDANGAQDGRIDEYVIYNAMRGLTSGSDSVLWEAMKASGESSLALGITSVQDMAGAYGLATVRGAAKRGPPPVRYRVIRFLNTDKPGGWREDWRISGADTALAETMHVSGTKLILDGTPIERLALMRRPYADRPGWHGRANFPFDTLRAMLRESLARRDQPMIHAVGDSAIQLVLNAMRQEAPDSAWRRLRPRLEHADALGRDQLASVRSLGIIVVQNPSHLGIPDVMNARWGDALPGMNMLRTLVDSGVPLALGSDGPREPGLNIMLATLHPNVPFQALTREQAVTAYTRGSAYAAFAEGQRGTLRPGMLADIAVLSQDIFTVVPEALPATTSVLTMVGGQVLLDRLAR